MLDVFQMKIFLAPGVSQGKKESAEFWPSSGGQWRRESKEAVERTGNWIPSSPSTSETQGPTPSPQKLLLPQKEQY